MSEDIKGCLRDIEDAVSSLRELLTDDPGMRTVERILTLLPTEPADWNAETTGELQQLALSLEQLGSSIGEAAEQLRFAVEDIEEALKSP